MTEQSTSSNTEYVPPADQWVRDQLAEIDAAGDTRVVSVADRPVAVFTIIGVKSGKPRRVPLMRVEHDGRYAAVASKGGAPEHPMWYASLRANPQVTILDGTTTGQYVARELPAGPERDEWWERCVAAYPPYADYQANTDRLIPVFVCEPQR